MKKNKIITAFLLVCSLLFSANQSNSASFRIVNHARIDDGINEFGIGLV